MNNNERKNKLPKIVFVQALILGLIFLADQVFGFFEQNFFNTYLSHVLGLEEIYVSIMVSLSATMGLIFMFVWGIKSDNTRSERFGRRRPYLLIGGIVAGIAAIFYGFSPNYLWAVFIDVVIIGIFANAYYASARALVPDIIEKEFRGRANGIITAFGNLGILIAVAFFLIVNELFTVPNPRGEGTILTQQGHIFVLSVGGIMLIACSILGFVLIKEKPISELPPKKPFIKELKEIVSVQELKKNEEFFKITLAYTVFQTGVGVVLPFLFIFLFSLGLTTLQFLIGIVIGFPILILVTINLGKLSDKYGRKKFVPTAILISGSVGALMSFVLVDGKVNLILFYIVLPFILISLLGLATLLNAWSQDLLPENQRGKFFGILNIVFTVSQIIGAFAAGIIAEIYGLQWIFTLALVFYAVSVIFFLRVKETYIPSK